MTGARAWIIPVLAVAVVGIATPLALVWRCEGEDRGIGMPGACGYPIAWLDQLAVTTLDWIGLSSLLFGVPILIFWGLIFVITRLIVRRI